MKTAYSCEIEEISPDQAAEWLGHNSSNRAIRWRRVMALSKDIRADKFVVNGETIIISKTGKLMNGQHRLSAVVEAKQSIESFVVRGIPDELMTTIDQGTNRSNPDVFGFSGITYPKISAAVARLLWEFDTYGVIDNKSSPTRTMVIEVYRKHEAQIREAVPNAYRLKPHIDMPIATMAVVEILIGRKSTRALEFFDALAATEPSAKDNNSPLGAMQRYLRAPRRRTRSNFMVPMLLKIWNAWVLKEPLSIASYRSGEPFPEIEG